MSTIESNSITPSRNVNGNIIGAMLPELQSLIDQSLDRLHDADYYHSIDETLRKLHACLRAHHAAGYFPDKPHSSQPIPPEWMEQLSCLRDEHMHFLGFLDRLIRSCESVADRPLEDREVFFLRIQELMAMMRRHEVEEDRILYLAIWRDVGGEC